MSSVQDQDRLAHIALNRFGLGPKPGALARIRADAKAAVLAELDTPGIAAITDTTLPNYVAACQIVDTDFTAVYNLKETELAARLTKHKQPDVGFVERLVIFFSNHFSMSVNKDTAIMATLGQLERGVIRKNVLGTFKNMLIGVMKHPAMQRYLDNCDSIGPNSAAGKDWGVGLNHNLAREICELHTLGVNGGYTENDIDALAAALTGWSYVRGWEADGKYNGGTAANRGQFIYRPTWHEPGSKKFLGVTFKQTGQDQALAMLTYLATHPSTAQFIAYKLVRHFITDDPTPAMVNPLAATFRNTGGNLKAVARRLVNLADAFTAPLKKFRTPYELQVAELRALQRSYTADESWIFQSPLYALHNYPWEHVTPDGYPDETTYWLAADAMRIRLETAQLNAYELAQKGPYTMTVPQMAQDMYGAGLSGRSRQAITAAPDLESGLTMLFMVPEFQRR